MKLYLTLSCAFLLILLGVHQQEDAHNKESLESFKVYYYFKIATYPRYGNRLIFSEVKSVTCNWNKNYVGSSQRTAIQIQFHDWFRARYRSNLKYKLGNNINVFEKKSAAVKALNREVAYYNNNRNIDYAINFNRRFTYVCNDK